MAGRRVAVAQLGRGKGDIPPRAEGEGIVRFGLEGDVSVRLSGPSLSVEIPVGCARPVYHRQDRDAIWLSDDVRLLLTPVMHHDPCGLLALLELVAPVAPFTPWVGIRLAPSGMTLRVDLATLGIVATPVPWPDAALADDAVGEIGTLLDAALRTARPERLGVLLFSGGVDSGVIAARLARLDLGEVVLVHSSRGENDRETAHARAMAQHLGLPFHRTDYVPAEALRHFPAIVDAPWIATDFSTLPTWALADQVADRWPEADVIWDGSGADALYGGLSSVERWRRIYRVPGFVRRMAAARYATHEEWTREGRRDDVLRLIRRSTRWPDPFVAVSGHAMGGILFRDLEAERARLVGELAAWYDHAGSAIPGASRPKLLGVTYANAGGHCRKAMGRYARIGADVAFPFLHTPVVAHGLGGAATWPREWREGKGALKQLLARHVPHEMVYREKSGFSIPAARTFGEPAFIQAFDEVMESSGGPFSDLIARPSLHRVREHLVARRTMAWYTYEAIWAIVVGHHWITRAEAHMSQASTMAFPPLGTYAPRAR